MNNHELQFIAWLKSDKEYWKDIESDGYRARELYPYSDLQAAYLKEECFFNLEDYNPFSEEFMSHVNLDDVCLFLVDSQEYPYLFEDEFKQIDQLVELKKKAEDSVKDDGVGTVLGFYLSAQGLRNMEVGHG